jgi:hypothetical protein
MFKFFEKKIDSISYFLLKIFKKTEIFSIIFFVIVFVFIDRKFSKKVKVEKTKAPNVLWRIFGFILYTPLWYKYVYPCFMFFKERTMTSDLETIFYYEFSYAVESFFTFTEQIELFFGGKFAFVSLYQLFLYLACRLLIKIIPQKNFYIPMYIRYHIMVNSILIMLLDLVDEPYRTIADIIPDSSGKFFEITTKDESFAVSCSFYMFIFYFLLIGNYTWKACQGKSFINKKGFFDILIRTHLSADSLYKNEKWSDYGMDDLTDYENFF